MKNFISNNRTAVIGVLSVATMFLLWEALALHYGSSQIMPGPKATLLATFNLFIGSDFLSVVGSTLLRGLAGFALAALLGLLLGILGGLSAGFDSFLRPWVVVMRSTPVVAFVLLALIWFTSSNVPVFIGFLTMFPMIYTNVSGGIRSVDRNLVEMARFYKVSRRRTVSEVYMPAIAPFITAGLSTAVGIGWRAIIIGEVLSQPKYGIGTMMHDAQSFLRVDILIAWTVVAVLLSALFDKLLKKLKICHWNSKI